MKWEIQIHSEEQYAEVITSGLADKDGSMKMAIGITPTLLFHKINRVLVDHRNVESVIGETADVFYRQKEFVRIGMVRPVKIALLVDPRHKDFFHMFELVLTNRGFNVSVFQEKPPALEWLLSKPTG